MNANTMELNPEQMEQITGAIIYGGSDEPFIPECRHPHAVKTPWERETEFYIFWTRHQFAYLCPDCKKYFWASED